MTTLGLELHVTLTFSQPPALRMSVLPPSAVFHSILFAPSSHPSSMLFSLLLLRCFSFVVCFSYSSGSSGTAALNIIFNSAAMVTIPRAGPYFSLILHSLVVES